ncbi:MAG: hypothetical protein PVH88_17195 [Ignavibacteria bacterium]
MTIVIRHWFYIQMIKLSCINRQFRTIDDLLEIKNLTVEHLTQQNFIFTNRVLKNKLNKDFERMEEEINQS